ncbi:MAG: hypothetical protein ACR2NU_10550 [Aeoliella sp.]
MPGTGKTPPASSDRPLPLVARADLVAKPVSLRGEISWMVKDPVSLDYCRLTAEQYAVLKMLDGTQSVTQLRTAFVHEFPACRPSLHEMQRLAFDLFDKGLAYSTRQGQGESLAERGRERRRRQLKSAPQSLLYIRLPGFDPKFLLRVLYPLMQWMFRPVVAGVVALLLFVVWTFLFIRFDQVVSQLPDAALFASPRMLLLLWITLGVAKLLHELGHAVACKHFGGECHEIGIAFLVFSPCLYCDVSDAATFSRRWQRLVVCASGMYVELALSAVAAIVWWHTEPGLLRNMCLCLFLVTNVSTIAFNLNPLLRFDGYFLLADWLETPNLRRRSNDTLHRALAKHLAGVTLPEQSERSEPRQFWLLTYAIASSLYRWAFLLVVTLSLHALLKPYGLGAVGLLLGTMAAVAGLVGSGVRLWRFIDNHRTELGESNRPRVAGVAALTLIVGLFVIPLPLSIEVPLFVQPVGIKHVYVATPGRLSEVHVEPGDRVVAGQLLAELQNHAKGDRYETLRTAFRSQNVEVTVHQAIGDAAAEAAAGRTLHALYEEGRDYHQQWKRLSLTAPCAGVVVESPAVLEVQTGERGAPLPKWQRSPLEHANRGAHLEKGTHFVSIAPDGGYHAILLIDQNERAEFREGTQVRMQLDALPGNVFLGTVASVAKWVDQPELMPQSPESIYRVTNPAGGADTRYQARVEIDSDSLSVPAGMSGTARVLVTHRTAAQWMWRQFRLTFHHRL